MRFEGIAAATCLLLACSPETHDRNERLGRTEAALAVQQAKLTSASTANGTAVAISGNTAIILASSAAWAWVRSGATWSEQQKLLDLPFAAEPVGGGANTHGVALDGETALIGVPQDNSVYVFVRAGTTWTQQARFQPFVGTSSSRYGASVALHGDLALVGIPGGEAVAQFTRTNTTWTAGPALRSLITGGVAPTQSSGFGASVALSSDSALVGNGNNALFSFARTGNAITSFWSVYGSVTPGFASSLSISGDTAVVGAVSSSDLTPTVGSAFVYTRSGITWTQSATLAPSGGADYDFFGSSVALSGEVAVIGSPGDDDKGSSSGSAYVFGRSGGTWTEREKIVPADGYVDGRFGIAVALSLGTALIGAPGSSSRSEPGAGYVFLIGDPDGTPCTTNTACASGKCVDGVCCDSLCTGSCQSCLAAHKGSGANGTCGLIAAGTDPKNACGDQGAATCGTTGSCDGVSTTCGKYTSATTCVTATCANATTENPADKCDGVGSCIATATKPCNVGYACVGAACRTTCTGDGDCAAGYGCHTASSQCRKIDGAQCDGATECKSAFCVDSVCCATSCTGTCQACSAAAKTSGASGTCGPAKVATDPRESCADQGPTSCGTNGACDGAGACAKYPLGTSCGSGTCNGTTFNAANSCDGNGTCATSAASTQCAPHLCVAPTGCKKPCAGDTDCVSGFKCHVASGECRKSDGADCALASECASGSCVDLVCCATACTGACQACSAARKTTGTSGTCGPSKVGTDFHDDCAELGAASCGSSGTCDGAGSCALYATTAQCAAGSCASATTENPPDFCNGTGTCAPTPVAPCLAGYACVGGGCRTTCTTDVHCATGFGCHVASGQCRKIVGATCAAATDCASGFCADGVCCDAACTGACSACSAALKQGGSADGTCGAARSNTDPHDSCADQGASTCGTNGLCNGAGACSLFASGTSCGVGSCSGTQLTSSAACDGLGACKKSATVTDCAPYVCDPAGCKSPCATDADCVTGNACEAGACKPLRDKAATCSRNAECKSGFCVDKVCCETACNTGCVACSAAAKGQGEDGTCGNAASGLDPHDDCARDPGFPASCKSDGACDGSGKCRAFARLGTACGTTSCAGGRVSGSLCDGVGACKAGSEVPCDPFGCSGNDCGTSCTSNAFCASAAICGPAGVCVAQKQMADACSTDGECNSGYCVDGVCCNAICTGQCEACDGAGTKGKCLPATGAPHGKRAACSGAASACAGACDGANPASCTYPGASTTCGEGKACDKGACVQVRAVCKDAQTSSPPGGAEASCIPFACDGATGVCRQACAASSECAAGYLCEAPRCVPVTAAEVNDDGGGCGCRVTGAGTGRDGLVLAIAALVGLRIRRARRSRSTRR